MGFRMFLCPWEAPFADLFADTVSFTLEYPPKRTAPCSWGRKVKEERASGLSCAWGRFGLNQAKFWIYPMSVTTSLSQPRKAELTFVS